MDHYQRQQARHLEKTLKSQEHSMLVVINPIRALENVLDEKREFTKRLYYSTKTPYVKHVDVEVLGILEPLVNALNLLQARIKTLEDQVKLTSQTLS
jgi:hypothetical protein